MASPGLPGKRSTWLGAAGSASAADLRAAIRFSDLRLWCRDSASGPPFDQLVGIAGRSPTAVAKRGVISSSDSSPGIKVTWDVDPVILAAARKHGVQDDDMLHAYRNPMRVFQLDDLTMLVGPSESASLLEIGVAHAEGIDFIVHAMPARDRFLE